MSIISHGRYAPSLALVLIGCGLGASIGNAAADEAYSLECNYTTVYYYRGHNLYEIPGATVITIDPAGDRFSENGAAWEGIFGTSAQIYILRDSSEELVDEPLAGLLLEKASISRDDGHYSVRYQHYYEIGKVPVLTTERIGECKPTELRTPS
ncbi:MAG: hypothetical protein VCC99_09455 [Alphaproteobacteria bacterium]